MSAVTIFVGEPYVALLETGADVVETEETKLNRERLRRSAITVFERPAKPSSPQGLCAFDSRLLRHYNQAGRRATIPFPRDEPNPAPGAETCGNW
jgi:hypothetical protein